MCRPSRQYPSDLSDHEWEILASLIPPAKPGGRPRKWPMHKILNAVFYVVRTGCQWRLLPHDFPPWSTVHHYFRLWRLDGTWERINAALRQRTRLRAGRDPQPSAGILDTQSVKTTSVGGVRGYDGAKKLNEMGTNTSFPPLDAQASKAERGLTAQCPATVGLT